MSQVCIHYFSGTGNTERSARLLESLLSAKGETVTLKNIEHEPVPPLERFDAHIFMFCILSWSAPAIMKRYIRSFPRSGGSRGAVLAVFGGGSDYDGDAGQGVPQIARMLRRRGLEVTLTGGIANPSNWVQFTNPPDEAGCAAVRERSDRKIEAFAEAFIKGEKRFYRVSALSRLFTSIPALFFGLLGRRVLGMSFIADSSCTKCGLCAKSCPVHAISMKGPKGKPCWNAECENCNRCMNICPARSIQTSVPRLVLHLTLNIAAIIAAEKIPGLLIARIPLTGIAATAASFAAGIALYAAFCAIQLYIADRLILLLQYIPPVDAFFRLTFTKRFRRYIAPGFKG